MQDLQKELLAGLLFFCRLASVIKTLADMRALFSLRPNFPQGRRTIALSGQGFHLSSQIQASVVFFFAFLRGNHSMQRLQRGRIARKTPSYLECLGEQGETQSLGSG